MLTDTVHTWCEECSGYKDRIESSIYKIRKEVEKGIFPSFGWLNYGRLKFYMSCVNLP